ncbi:MAG: putative zinc-binding protein [Methanomicrobiaceae archaeon]|nr:putative zinc-binding protein [Methanomicrobiaceae archaeon]
MAEQQPVVCFCGGPGVPEGGKKLVLFPCAGASNTGQISNSAAVQLTLEGYGILACTAGVPVRAPSTMKKVESAEYVVAIDGCPVGCARKLLEQQNVRVNRHIVVTELGIEKTGDPIADEKDVETVVSAAWEQ